MCMCLFPQVWTLTKSSRKGASCPYFFLIVDDPITNLKGGLLIFSTMLKWYLPVFDNKTWTPQTQLCGPNRTKSEMLKVKVSCISTEYPLISLIDIWMGSSWYMCSHCSYRYLDGIKLLQRGGGGRVGRGCWRRGQLLVIILYILAQDIEQN